MLRVLFALTGLAATAPAFAQYPDIAPADGERIVFDVYRGNSEFGTHELSFTRNGDGLEVDIAIRLRAGFGPITVFRYEHDSTEVWRDGRLVSLDARTLKDGDTYEVSAGSVDGALAVDGEGPDRGSFETRYDPGILPSSHWHGYPDGTYPLLNTEFGTELGVEVVYIGREEIEADGRTIMAEHYRLNSELQLDIWFDENGRWAKCAFTARGQDITYVRRFDPLDGAS